MWEKIESFVSKYTQLIFLIPLRVFFLRLLRLKVYGKENIKKLPSSFIVAVNHVSYVDHFLFSCVFPLSGSFYPFRFPTAVEIYRVLRFIIRPLGAFPIQRGLGVEVSAAKALRLLQKGQRIVIYPEGKIDRGDGSAENAQRGVAYLASKTGAPILPIYMHGFDAKNYMLGFSIKKLFLRKYRLALAVGEPFFIQEVFGKIPENREEYKQAAQKVMERVYSLKTR